MPLSRAVDFLWCPAKWVHSSSFPPFPFHTHRDGILTILSESLTKEMCDSFVMHEQLL